MHSLYLLQLHIRIFVFVLVEFHLSNDLFNIIHTLRWIRLDHICHCISYFKHIPILKGILCTLVCVCLRPDFFQNVSQGQSARSMAHRPDPIPSANKYLYKWLHVFVQIVTCICQVSRAIRRIHGTQAGPHPLPAAVPTSKRATSC